MDPRETARQNEQLVRKSDDAEDEFSERFLRLTTTTTTTRGKKRKNPGGRAHAGAENGRWVKFLRRGR